MPMTAQTINLKEGDTVALQYLGAAVVLQWDNLPKPVQDTLLQQASSVGGLPVGAGAGWLAATFCEAAAPP